MPVVFRDNETFSNLRGNIKDIGNVMLQKQIKDQEEKKAVQQMLQKLVLETALKNKQFKQGTDLSSLDTSQGMGGILGQMNPMLEQARAIPQTSISISERPYTEMQKAREVLQRSPEEYYGADMATGQGSPEGGWFFGLGNKGYVKDAKGNPIKSKPTYSNYNLSPEAQEEQAGARTILGNPTRTTKRISYKGGVVDTTAQDVTNELPDPASYDEGTIIEDENNQQYKLENGEWISQ